MKTCYVKIIFGLSVLPMLILDNSAFAANFSAKKGLNGQSARHFYIGANLGKSTLKPDVKSANSSVYDKSDFAYKLNIGYQIKPKIAVEGFYADLGSAGVNSNGTSKGKINYELYGLSGLFKQPFGKRMKGVVKAGYAKVNNSATSGVRYKQLNSGVWFAGLGLEYTISRKLSFVAEYENYDKDIKFLSAGIRWHF